MINAFFGLSARADAAHASLVVADALSFLGRSVTLLRVTVPGDAALPKGNAAPQGVRILEREARAAGAVAATLLQDIAAAVCADHDLVLDLPGACATDPQVSDLAGVRVVTVGPTPFHEHQAASLMASAGEGGKTRPAWLLACGRSGGDAVATFRRNVSHEAALLGVLGPCRILPATLPSLRRSDAESLALGAHTTRTLRAGLALVAALRAVQADPAAAKVDDERFERELLATSNRGRLPDHRDVGDRLHDLADELGEIGDGARPTGVDIEAVPRLEDWRVTTKAVHAIAGRVFGHPDIPDGRHIVSSDLYASDYETWARTLSRYYVLGSRAPD